MSEETEVDPRSSTAQIQSVLAEKSEAEMKADGDIPIHDAPEEATFTGSPPGPASGTHFEDPTKGSTVDIPRHDLPAHQRPANLDPQTNGPFADEVSAERERVYRETRNVGNSN